jgi:hypothetical protein
VVNVGVTHDTAEFAVESIRRWWKLAGRHRKQGANRILICADAGGSNSSRSRTWKLPLQELADELGMAITVCHYPPATSKWNKIEHRLFSFISLTSTMPISFIQRDIKLTPFSGHTNTRLPVWNISLSPARRDG